MASSSTASSPLLYSCIAHNSTILTEHTSSASSQASSFASVILPKINHSKPEKLTYTSGPNFVHYISCAASEFEADARSAGSLTFLVVAKESLGRRIPFGYLVEIRKKFFEQYPANETDFSDLPSYGCAAFNTTLKGIMISYGTTEVGQKDAIRNAQQEIDDVREIMSQNIEQVLERGERIDLLVDKTDRLGGSARDFRVRSTGLRRTMWWKNVRLMVLLSLVGVFLIYLFVGFGCGLPAWGRCIGHQ
jgi:vesicle-associated membrane protein 7